MKNERKRIRAIVALGLLLAWCARAGALNPSLDISQYAHTAWKNWQGFAKGEIHGIAQSPDGYLWLPTEFALLRFDGVRAVPWQPPAGESLPSKRCTQRSGRFGWDSLDWNSQGACELEPRQTNSLSTVRRKRRPQSIAAARRHGVGRRHHLGKGPTPIGGSTLCAVHGARVECYGQDGSFGPYGVTAMFEDSRCNLWLGAGSGIWRWKPGAPQHFGVPGLGVDKNSGYAFPWSAFAETRSGELLIAQPARGILQFLGGKFKPYKPPSGEPQLHRDSLLRDRDGGLWIGTEDVGLLHVHEGRIDRFDQSDGLSSNSVQNLFEDREGNIWVASVAGIDSFREYVVPNVSVKQGLSTPFVQSVLAARDGAIWLGTPNGLNRWNNGQITIYRRPSNAASPQRAESAETVVRHRPGVHEITTRGLPDDEVGSLYEDDRGRIWVSTGGGVAYIENGTFVPLSGVRLPSWSLGPVARDKAEISGSPAIRDFTAYPGAGSRNSFHRKASGSTVRCKLCWSTRYVAECG